MEYTLNNKCEIVEDDKLVVVFDENMNTITFLGELEKTIFEFMKSPFSFFELCSNVASVFPDYDKNELTEFLNQLVEKNIIISLSKKEV